MWLYSRVTGIVRLLYLLLFGPMCCFVCVWHWPIVNKLYDLQFTIVMAALFSFGLMNAVMPLYAFVHLEPRPYRPLLKSMNRLAVLTSVIFVASLSTTCYLDKSIRLERVLQ